MKEEKLSFGDVSYIENSRVFGSKNPLMIAEYVTKAKNQGGCGSCAAFGEAGLFESVMLKAGAEMKGLDLSEQYLVDCAYQKNDNSGR